MLHQNQTVVVVNSKQVQFFMKLERSPFPDVKATLIVTFGGDLSSFLPDFIAFRTREQESKRKLN